MNSGPNWIHGTEGNPIYDMVKEANMSTYSFGVSTIIDNDGNKIDSVLAERLSGILWSTISDAIRYSAQRASHSTIGIDESLSDFLQEHIPGSVRAEFPTASEAKHRMWILLILQLSDVWGTRIGSKTSSQSLRYLWLEECLDGEDLFCAGTYEKVLKQMAKSVLGSATLHLNTTVTQIRGRQPGSGNAVILGTESGAEFSCDQVVMTAPLGWLKRNQHVFEPRMSRRMTTAIEELGYGMLDKVYITFPRAFWHTDDSQATSTLFLRPFYLEESPLSGLTQEAIVLSNLPAPHAHPTLLFYTCDPTSGILAGRLSTSSTPNTPARDADTLLPIFLPYISRLPNYRADDPDCIPVAILATNWKSDRLAGYGSYTFFPAGTNSCDEHIETLREGMPDRGIHIAGEHVAPFIVLGTVTGAWMSGDLVARRLLGL